MTTYEMLTAKVAELQQAFPTVGFTFGYIGNCDARFDDRAWKIFAKRPHTSFGGYRGDDLEGLAASVNSPLFTRWLTRTVVTSQLEA